MRQYTKRTREERLAHLKARKDRLIKQLEAKRLLIEKIGDQEQRIQNRMDKKKASSVEPEPTPNG